MRPAALGSGIARHLPALLGQPAAFGPFLQACPIAAIAVDAGGAVIFWNASAQAIFGWMESEVLGHPLPIVPSGSEAAYVQILCERPEPPPHPGRQLRALRKDGTTLTVRLWNTALPDASGRIEAHVVLFADITRELQRDQEMLSLVQSERAARAQMIAMDRFRELLEAAPDAIIEVDSSGKIVLANAATEQTFGYLRDDLIGRPVEDLIPLQARSRHIDFRASYAHRPVRRPMGLGLTLLAQRKDGSQFPVEISLSPVESSGDDLRISTIIRDVSERSEAEEKLHITQEKFASQLAAANRELEHRNQQVERADRLKSEFLAGVSHELRTPLHTVIGFSELLLEELEGPLNAKQKRFLGHIHKDSLHLLQLINDVLDISKIEAGKLELHLESFDAAQAVHEAVSSIEPLSCSKNITLVLDNCQQLVLFADRMRFKQILYNLLSNAVKFTPTGGRVSVSCCRSGTEAQFCIADTGVGIDPAEQHTIFQKFYQVGSTTRGVREGTGLGLSITHSLVEEHGGRIWVESQPGMGSKFFFSLPIQP